MREHGVLLGLVMLIVGCALGVFLPLLTHVSIGHRFLPLGGVQDWIKHEYARNVFVACGGGVSIACFVIFVLCLVKNGRLIFNLSLALLGSSIGAALATLSMAPRFLTG